MDGMNDAVMRGAEALAASDYVIVTLGTAWVYEKDGRTVANCHKLPAAEFERRLLSTDEIVGALSSAMERELNGKDVVFSVSPIRHLKDGFAGNSLSKALLRVAVEYVVRRYDRAHYFPSFEIMNDDLRDYRFYEADMAHPSVSAVDYIWEKFRGAFLSEQAADVLPQVEKIVDASRHRPIDSRSEQYRDFLP
ncbi:MAG: GSCFA domain-containing protein [Alistipes putredinis]|nr:MAG: GSCFA domain-containing protein [Alistipes putredinis]